MGKALAIAVIAFIALGTFYSSIRARSEIETTRNVSDYQYYTLARNVALTGVNQARQALVQSFESTDLSGTSQGGDYDVTITVADDIATIVSTGSIRGASDGGAIRTYTITVRLVREDELPEFLRYAVLTDQDFEMSGSSWCDVYGGDPDYNADVHTNGELSSSSSGTTTGFGTYVSPSDEASLLGTFSPSNNPAGDPSVSQVDSVEIPTFTATDFLASIGGATMTTNGDVSLSSDFDTGGTKENPYIWHIKGKLTVSGGTQVSGYNIFVVEGKVTFSGGSSGGVLDASATGKLGIFAQSEVTLSGGSVVDANIYTNGKLTLSGGSELNGSATAKGEVKLSGESAVHFVPMSASLAGAWSEGGGIRVTHYFESQD